MNKLCLSVAFIFLFYCSWGLAADEKSTNLSGNQMPPKVSGDIDPNPRPQQADLKRQPTKGAPKARGIREMGPKRSKAAPRTSDSEIPTTVTGTQGERDRLDK